MEKQYIKTFQGLRWFACLFVFISHAFSWFVFGGKFSVVIFFCLSGFLAQMKAKKNSEAHCLNECKKNFFHSAKKFLPLHWIMLVLTLLPSIIYKSDSCLILILEFIFNATLLQCWIPNTTFAYSFNGVSWYLSVALFFATISPFVTSKIANFSLKNSIFGLAAILCFQLGFSFCSIPGLDLFFYVFPPIRIFDCVAGCLLFQTINKLHSGCKKWVVNLVFFLSIISFTGLMIVINFVPNLGTFGAWFSVAVWSLPAWGLVFSLSQEQCLCGAIKAVFSNKLSVFLGGITFEFYMIHKVILNCGSVGFRLFLHHEWNLIMVITAFLVSLGLSLLIHFVDKSITTKVRNRKTANCNKSGTA